MFSIFVDVNSQHCNILFSAQYFFPLFPDFWTLLCEERIPPAKASFLVIITKQKFCRLIWKKKSNNNFPKKIIAVARFFFLFGAKNSKTFWGENMIWIFLLPKNNKSLLQICNALLFLKIILYKNIFIAECWRKVE